MTRDYSPISLPLSILAAVVGLALLWWGMKHGR